MESCRKVAEQLVERPSAELSRSISVARITSRGGTGTEPGGEKRWAFAEYICGTDSSSGREWCGAGRREALSFRGVYLWRGFLVVEVLVRSREARSAELSRTISVARIPRRGGTGAKPGGEKRWVFAEYICGTDSSSWRYWCEAGRREALSFRGVYLWHGFLVGEGLVRSREARSAELSRSISVARITGRGGTGAEPGGEKRWAFAVYICGTDSWSGRDWCGAARRGALSFRGVYLWHEYWRHRDATFLVWFLCHRAKMAEKVVTFLSSRLRQIYRKQESRGKSASQLTASGQRKFQGKRRALESHSQSASRCTHCSFWNGQREWLANLGYREARCRWESLKYIDI